MSQYIQAKLVVKDYVDGNENTVSAISESLVKAKKNWEIKYRGLYDNNNQQLIDLNTQATQQQEAYQARRKEEQKANESLNKEYADFLSTSKDEWAKLKATYDSELALKAPTTYWTEQKDKYRRQSYGFGFLTLGLIGGLGYIITRVAKFEGLTKISEISVFHLALLILSTAVSIWIVQLCAKMFLSRFHLHTEASLRVLTIKTYLSLKKEDNADKENFNFMLQQIFKPLKTGLTKEKDITDNLSVIINALRK